MTPHARAWIKRRLKHWRNQIGPATPHTVCPDLVGDVFATLFFRLPGYVGPCSLIYQFTLESSMSKKISQYLNPPMLARPSCMEGVHSD